MTVTATPPASAPPGPARTRILATARAHLFTYGYTALTMDDLARELGMSKKTLYVHFPGKDAITSAIIDAIGAELHTRFDAVLSDPDTTFLQKVGSVTDIIGDTLGRASPAMFRDLQRSAPAMYQKIEDLRQKTVPFVFGRLICAGIAEGMVLPDVDPAFATEFWLQAIRGLVQPAVLERTQLTLRQTVQKALPIFFTGLLTSAGRKNYEKHLRACEKRSAS
ncbi:MAG: TetR/AcrR family transcriptional regulator [Opitutaceae bacterium]|nr:TetR/AcrR family transcriptional regulator [Opitutaceae bacterium]